MPVDWVSRATANGQAGGRWAWSHGQLDGRDHRLSRMRKKAGLIFRSSGFPTQWGAPVSTSPAVCPCCAEKLEQILIHALYKRRRQRQGSVTWLPCRCRMADVTPCRSSQPQLKGLVSLLLGQASDVRGHGMPHPAGAR